MNAIERLDAYLRVLRRRLHAHIYVSAAAYAAVGVLVLVLGTVWSLAREGYDPFITFAGRAVIGTLLLAIAVLALWAPLRRLRRNEGAHVFEHHLPSEQGRLVTYLDGRHRQQDQSPLIELLAEDAATIASSRPVDSIIPRSRIYTGLIVAIAGFGVLAAMLLNGPSYWGFASRHVLLGTELPREVVPIRRITLTPGNATVRRNSDLAIRAATDGFEPTEATMFVRFADQTQWESAPMQRMASEGGGFELKLYALRSPLEYYVVADGIRSAQHAVTLADLPRIEAVRLTYHYPDWTGLDPQTDAESRDIRAVAGTKVSVEVRSDAPLENPVLIHDGEESVLASRKGVNEGTLSVDRAGSYRISARVAGEQVALSDDYSIDIVPDEKPTVQIERPGRDWRATNIEEVPVRVQAADDFQLQNLELRYSVNGGKWQSVRLGRNVKQTREETLLELEQLGTQQAPESPTGLLSPGDLVSYYAVAKDHKRSVQTDLFMVQVQPFERRFLQQNSGGGAGMGDEQGAISERQREILLATWNLQRSDDANRRSRDQLKDNANMLADMQSTLAQQARTLAARTRARSRVEEDERIKTFVESLEQAAVAMDPAALHLSAFELEKAVPVEQQALQQLLRAEAAFREVQVSMQRDGAQGSQSARDFSEMFELEMDVEKSQYESEQQFSQENANEEMEEAVRKLKELAERQERLAQEANRNSTLTPEQRWRQEQLRREAEDLRRRLAAMNQQQSQQQSASQSQSGSSSQSSAQGERSQDALESMDQALSQMQAANSETKPAGEQQADAAREAGEKLKKAAQQLQREPASGLDSALDEFAERAAQLEREQREIEADLYQALRQANQPGPPRRRVGQIDDASAQSLVEDKQKMAETLSELQKDLRNSVHQHRSSEAQAKQRLTQIVNDVESSDLMYRVRRSAAEIYYGRARDAAAREGLITESLQVLEKSLREAAAQAGEEGTKSADEKSTSDKLLAEVADLRRRVEERQRMRAAAGGQAQQPGSEGERGESQNQNASTKEQAGNASSQQGSSSGQTGDRALSAWDPNLANTQLPDNSSEARNAARQSESIGNRATRLLDRASNREVTQAELASLRRMARELRQLAGDPLAAESAAMKKAVAQIELAALAAVTNSMRTETARTTVPVDESAEYREAVAEYYRRLGGS